MNKIFSAMAVALILGCTTLMIAAFRGPVLKKRKKTVRNTKGKAHALLSIKIEAIAMGVAINIPIAETRKYALRFLACQMSARKPPNIVPAMPATTVVEPNN